MSTYEMERIAQTFHAVVFETGTTIPGIVVKMRWCYLKIYDTNDDTYTIQYWLYGKTRPEFINVIKRNELTPWMHKNIHDWRLCNGPIPMSSGLPPYVYR